MATVYSGEVTVGNNVVRLKCDYSGASATLTVQFRRASGSWTDTWYDNGATLTMNGETKAAAYSYIGTVTTNFVDLVSVSGYTISTGGGTYGWTFSNPLGGLLGCSGSITIPSQSSAPTDLAVSNVVLSPDSVSAIVSISSWGTGGDPADYRRSLSICVSQDTTNRRVEYEYGSTLSSTITVDNNSTEQGTCTLSPNTLYYLRATAINGSSDSAILPFQPVATTAQASTVSLDSVTDTTVTINYSASADGGYYNKTIEYSLDGVTWSTGATVTGGSAATGSFTISGLTASTTYNIQTRVTTTAGSTAGSTVQATTAAPATSANLYGSVNGNTKKVVKLYGPVSDGNGGYETKHIVKLYGSVNGSAKLVYED